MPVLSAAAYDSLLLEKVKLVIQAVLQDPKTPPTTFEDFVVGFDVAQPLAYKLFDLLIQVRPPARPPARRPSPDSEFQADEKAASQETTKRRPRKVNVEPSTSSSSSGGAAGAPATARRTRTVRSHSPDPIDMLRARPERLHLTDSDDDDERSGGGARLRYQRAVATARAPPPPRVGRADDGVSPSTRLRQRQLAELFGSALRDTATHAGFPQNLADLLDDDDDHHHHGGTRQSRFSPSSASIPSALFAGEPLPTHQELWSMLVDDPFPPGGEASFFGFRMALNSTQAFAAAPVRAPSLRDLLDELADRDLAFPIRLSNLLAARNGNNDPARLRTGAGSSTGSSGSGDEAPAEGIWRASFVEHLDDGTTREVPISLGTIGNVAAAPPRANMGSSTTDGPTFAAFAERRRAERRARARGGGPAADVDSDAMNVDSPAGASSSTSGETPIVTVSQASTPATSAAHSPAPSMSASASTRLGAALAELCPPPARQQQQQQQRPTAAPTSASLAEAHFRSQRAIAPLPSHRGPSSTPSWTDPAGAALVADVIRDAIPDDVLSRIRDSVGAGQLDYDPSTGWSGTAVSNFATDQLDVVARTLVQIRRLRIRGTEEGGVDIEF